MNWHHPSVVLDSTYTTYNIAKQSRGYKYDRYWVDVRMLKWPNLKLSASLQVRNIWSHKIQKLLVVRDKRYVGVLGKRNVPLTYQPELNHGPAGGRVNLYPLN